MLQTYSDLEIIFDFPKDKQPVWVMADTGLMRQMLTNLMKNAIENMQETKQPKNKAGKKSDAHNSLRIDINISLEGEAAVITLRDYGSGFAGEDVERYLEPYITTRNKGTGLGLAIAQKIISDHDGQIYLSNHPEQGAIVRLVMSSVQPENGQQGAQA